MAKLISIVKNGNDNGLGAGTHVHDLFECSSVVLITPYMTQLLCINAGHL